MWIIVLSWCASVLLAMSLAFCLCWKKKNTTGDWQGLDGMVIQKNPDENVNHLPSAALSVPDDVSTTGDSDIVKRNITTTRRSLPDIPADQNSTSNWEPAVDNSSEHYATVGQYPNDVKRNALPNGVLLKSTPSQYSSTSDTDKPYESVKYDQMKSKEHPYAQLQPTTSRSGLYEENPSTPEERMNLLRTDIINPADPLAISSRSRRSSAHSNVEPDIPAASAVAGVLAASPELPYMTPPVNQTNFSGDSQDSSKGYTSISVREPLANIVGQTTKTDLNKRRMDPHYSTLSDDSSDDVYTTIADPKNPIYTSESETYARIEPLQITVEAEINQTSQAASAAAGNSDELYELPPEAPCSSGDNQKQVALPGGHTFTHSRQASTSSSIANVGSPKPEKRQANSPLPPPPIIINSFDFHSDKIQTVKNLDDMYAKVHKNKKEDVPEENAESSFSRIHSRKSLSGVTVESKTTPLSEEEEHNYETLKSRRTSDPCYEKIKGADEPGYASINGPESASGSDPGYEVLKNKSLSESDPNYEELRHRPSNASDFSGYSKIRDLLDGYSVVNKPNKNGANTSLTCNDSEEPNYESMPSERLSESESEQTSSCGNATDTYEAVGEMSDLKNERLDQGSKKLPDTTNFGGTGDKRGCESAVFKSSHPSSITDEVDFAPEQLQRTHSDRSRSKNVAVHTLCVVDENGIVQI